MVPVGASTRACELRTPYCSPSSTARSHASWAAESSSVGTSSSSMAATASRCMLQHVDHRLDVLVVPGEGSHPGGGAGRGGVGVPGHQGGDGGGPRPTLVGVVGQALGHEQGAEVGVADAQLTEAPRVLGDLVGRVVGVADDDLLGGEDDLDRGPEALDVERRVGVEELSAG